MRFGSRTVCVCLIIWGALGLFAWAARAHDGGHTHQTAERRLPVIGQAPGFLLVSQDGDRVSLAGLRGKAVVVSFIYTSCHDICPMLNAKLLDAREQARLLAGNRAGNQVIFLSITVDPGHDTPEVLKAHAQALGIDSPEWRFLTGTVSDIEAVARRYGVIVRRMGDRDVDHTMLTSLIDRTGRLRVQYLGARFAVEEFAADLASLAATR